MGRRPSILHGEWPVVLLLCTVALSIRLLVLAGWAETPLYHAPQGDELNFHRTAIAIVEGEPVEPFLYQPLYSYFLAAVYAVFGPSVYTGRHVQLALGVLAVLLFYALGHELARGLGESKQRWAGRACALLAACYGPLVFFEAQLLATALVGWLLAGSLWLLLAAGKRGHAWLALPSGLLLGLGVMGRPNLAVVALPAVVWLWRRAEGRPNKLASCILLLAGCAAGVAPSWIHNARTGMWWVPVSSSAGHSFFIGNNPDATGGFHVPRQYPIDASSHAAYRRSLTLLAEREAGRQMTSSQVSSFWFRKGLEFWRDSPLRAMSLTGWKIILLLNDDPPPIHHPLRFAQKVVPVLGRLPGFAFLLAFAALGLLSAWPHLQGPGLLRWCAALYGLGVVTFYVADRYRLPLAVILMPFAALGCLQLYSAARQRTARFAGKLAVMALALGIGLVPVESELRIRKQLSDGFNSTGNAAMELGDLAEAKRWYERAVEAAGTEHGAAPRTNLGLLYERWGKLDEAERLYREAARMNPRARLARRRLALLCERQGRLEEAVVLWRELAELEADPQPIFTHIHQLERRMPGRHPQCSEEPQNTGQTCLQP